MLTQSDNDVNSSVWTCIEPAVGIAACLSNMRPLFKLMHRKVWTRNEGSIANTSQREILGSYGQKSGWSGNTPSPNGDTDHSRSHGSPA